MSGAVPLLPLYASGTWTGTNLCYRIFFPKVRTDFMCNLRFMPVFELLNWNRIANLIVNYGSKRKSFRSAVPNLFDSRSPF